MRRVWRMLRNKRNEEEEKADESWLLPYADLLTLLLALFIVLYGMSTTDAKKFEQMSQAFSIAFSGGASGVLEQQVAIVQTGNHSSKKSSLYEKEQQNLEELKSNLDGYIKESGLNDQLDTELNHSELKITISESALFDSGSADMKEDSKNVARMIGQMLQEYPGYEMIVAGHTDNVPIHNAYFDSNWDLSTARALSFMKVLLNNSELEPKLFRAVGLGEYHPVDSNETVEGRAKNRRVEISILRKHVEKEPKTGIDLTNS